MLSKTENRVMSVLYEECKDKKSVLISPADIIGLAGGEITLTDEPDIG